MSLKELLGLGNEDISEIEIITRLKQAQRENSNIVEFTRKDGSMVKVEFPTMNLASTTPLGE